MICSVKQDCRSVDKFSVQRTNLSLANEKLCSRSRFAPEYEKPVPRTESGERGKINQVNRLLRDKSLKKEKPLLTTPLLATFRSCLNIAGNMGHALGRSAERGMQEGETEVIHISVLPSDEPSPPSARAANLPEWPR